MAASIKFPVLRQTLIVLAFIALVGLFFALNLLIFIPRQQQAYHDKIFRVLKEVVRDFENSLQGKADFIARNKYKKERDTSVYLQDCNYDSLKRNLLYAFDTLQNTYVKSDYFFDYSFIPDSAKLNLEENNKDTSVQISLHEVLKPSIEVLHKDEFDLVMLVNREKERLSENKAAQLQDRILFLYGELSASYVAAGDTLFKDARFGQFNSIIDVPIAGTTYKAFTLPFKLKEKQFLLTGFVNGNKYTVITSSYSLPVVLWIMALLIFFILSLPVVKIYLSSRQERLNTNDIRMLMVSFIAMPFIVVLITLTLLIYRSEDNTTTENLKKLHADVQQNFLKETRSAIQQLKAYDSIISFQTWLSDSFCRNKGTFFLNDTTADFRDIIFHPTRYKNLDDIFWVNEDGRQIAKWFFLQEPVSYLAVGKRNYFEKMKSGQGFVHNKDSFYLEPTISWASGKYSVNILTTSRQDFSSQQKTPAGGETKSKARMIALAGNMYSVYQPVVPKGYQFCITNADGKILFHTQVERNLRENLLEESNGNFELERAYKNKDSVLIHDVELYEKHSKLLVSPLPTMPEYYLVSYFSKREQNLFVFHISAFTLLCTLATLFGVLLLLLLYFLFGKKPSGQRFKTYDAALIKPSVLKQSIYELNIVQQLGLVVLFLVLFLFIFICNENHYWFLLQASVVFPFLVITSYILHRDEFNAMKNEIAHPLLSQKQSLKNMLQRNQRVVLIHLLTILFVLFSLNFFQESKYRVIPVACILLFALSPPLMAWTIRHSLTEPFITLRKGFKRLSYIGSYTLLVCLTIFSISVLPVMGIGSFAFKEEEQMKTKARQFQLANGIEGRATYLDGYLARTKLRNNKEDSLYKIARKYAPLYGIYLLNDSLAMKNFDKPSVDNHSVHSHFYQAITRFLFLPKDHTDFFENSPTYFWEQDNRDDKSLSLLYRNNNDKLNNSAIQISQNKESAILPPPKFSYAVALILLGVISFFVFHFFVIQAVLRKIFLLDYFDSKSAKAVNQEWMNEIYKTMLTDVDEELLGAGKETLDSDTIAQIEAADNHTKRQEKLLQIQYALSPAYEAIWNRLTPEAQFVLHDFAIDGFANYKNIDIIYSLFQRGLIVYKEHQLQLMTNSFRSYLLGKEGTDEILLLYKKFSTSSTWKNLKNIFFVLLFAILIFLFATQQDVSNRILAIVSGLATLVPLLLKIFDRSISTNTKPST